MTTIREARAFIYDSLEKCEYSFTLQLKQVDRSWTKKEWKEISQYLRTVRREIRIEMGRQLK